MRPASACEACRSHRRKCRLESNDRPCVRCTSLGVRCSLVPNFTHHTSASYKIAARKPLQTAWKGVAPASRSLSQETPTIGNALPIAYPLRKELVVLYFKHVHDKHHSLFHQPSVELELENGEVPDLLLYAMMALGMRFSNSETLCCIPPRDRGKDLVKKATRLLDVTDISVTTIQACVLLGTIAFSESKTEGEAVYYAIANRLASILDLAHRPVADEVERQVNLRIWWTLYMIDIWSSSGLQLPRQMGRPDNVSLPCEESVFVRLSKGSNTAASCRSSIWAEMVSLSHIWAEIHDLNKATVAGTMNPLSLSRAVQVLSDKLNDWSTALQPHLRPTRTNLERYASLGLGSALAALHLGFHYYNEVLFYQFLAEDSHDPTVPASSYADNCKSHAAQFCDLIYTCNQIPGCECVYIMVGHMLVVTSTVYMHTLLFSDTEDETFTARNRLGMNFEILTQLKTYWVKLDDSLSRLKAFHNACIASVESSFCMDMWMLSFILEHGTQVYEKFGSGKRVEGREEREEFVQSSPGTLQDWYSQTFAS